jgi:alpha-L-fucosidase 2
MKRSLLVLTVVTIILMDLFTTEILSKPEEQNSLVKSQRDMVLWYKQPGEKWLEGMPIGNGYMGAMVFGKVQNERIALNESTFWSGRPHDYTNPDGYKYYPQMRDLVFAGKYKEAEKMANEHFYGLPPNQQAFQPIGDLLLKFSNSENVKDYYRELDMETGLVKITYKDGDAEFTREVFMSYPDHVMVVHLTCNQPNRISLEAKFKSPYLENVAVNSGKLVMKGIWHGPLPKNMLSSLIANVDGNGMKFQTTMLAFPENGEQSVTDTSLVINNANSVTLILTIATSFKNYKDISGDPASACNKILSKLPSNDFNVLLKNHENDFHRLMDRVHLTIGDSSMNKIPTDERLKLVKEGGTDIDLASKIFQFGRYMLASSSREGGQPANLQGIWNEDQSPPWGSKYTTNINVEMNYWPAEVCNLSECTLPLFDAIKDLSVAGAITAKEEYNCRGWVCHHNFDLWRGTAPVDAARYGMWPVGGVWLCQHIWEHYLYTGDKKFLKEYYPIMKGSAQFLMDLMVIHPKYKWLVIPVSMSPEQGFFTSPGSEECFLTSSTTMDIGLTRELFPHCIEAERILNTDKKFGNGLEAALKKIPPYQIGKDGWLQVWLEDWQRGKEGHCISANFAFFPGSSITLRGTPKLADAIRKWLEPRRGNSGWIFSWDICDWARLQNKAKTDTLIKRFEGGRLTPNLHNMGNNQSDANFGFTAAVAECLIEVSMNWDNGKLSTCEIKSLLGNPCVVRYGDKTKKYNIPAGGSIEITGDM